VPAKLNVAVSLPDFALKDAALAADVQPSAERRRIPVAAALAGRHHRLPINPPSFNSIALEG
jgi:hypothetical protein